jgi:hypothetical protein
VCPATLAVIQPCLLHWHPSLARTIETSGPPPHFRSAPRITVSGTFPLALAPLHALPTSCARTHTYAHTHTHTHTHTLRVRPRSHVATLLLCTTHRMEKNRKSVRELATTPSHVPGAVYAPACSPVRMGAARMSAPRVEERESSSASTYDRDNREPLPPAVTYDQLPLRMLKNHSPSSLWSHQLPLPLLP